MTRKLRKPTPPSVLLAIPPPLAASCARGVFDGYLVNRVLPGLVRQIAAMANLPPPIDLFSSLSLSGRDEANHLSPGCMKQPTRAICTWFAQSNDKYARGNKTVPYSDDTHLNAQGYELVAQTVHRALLSRGLARSILPQPP